MALEYLSDILEEMSGDVFRLVPLTNLFPERHVYSAVSRAIVGRETLWYMLWQISWIFLGSHISELQAYLGEAESNRLGTYLKRNPDALIVSQVNTGR